MKITEDKLKILVILGTVREGRVSPKIAEWYLREAKKLAPHMEFEVFDLAQHPLPLFDQPVPPRMHQYGKLQQEVAETINRADGFVFINGEYNHSVPGSLKNFLDYLFAEWNYKAAAYVSYGAAGGGIRAMEHLVQIMAQFKVASVSEYIRINSVWAALDESGNPKQENIYGTVKAQLEELTFWATALKKARKELQG